MREDYRRGIADAHFLDHFPGLQADPRVRICSLWRSAARSVNYRKRGCFARRGKPSLRAGAPVRPSGHGRAQQLQNLPITATGSVLGRRGTSALD